MALLTIKPTALDIAIADKMARNTRPFPEQVANALTWGADEKVLLALALLGWLAARPADEGLRRASNHVLLVTVTSSLLPHLLKSVFDQTRPDRRTLVGHLHGISFAGKRKDAFPSGHALHMGALASAASALPRRMRVKAQLIAIGLSLTRVVTLAHWASDVASGFVMGVVIERILRLWTGYPFGLRGALARSTAERASAVARHGHAASHPAKLA